MPRGEAKLEIRENKLGIMAIDKLIIHMSLPMMISMLVQALYNIVDSIFVAKINEEALTAVSLAFPVQNFMIAIGVGTAVGINALLSRSLGEKNYKESNRAANNGIFLGFLSYLVFLVLGLLFTKTYFIAQTNDIKIIEYGTTYLTIINIASIGVFTQIIFERLLQSTGKSILSMITQGLGAIINIILDPILIFGYFGFPKMGVAGAAWATIIGQIVGAILGLYLNLKYNKEIKIQVNDFKPSMTTIKKIYSVGFPSIVMISITSITTYGLNSILMKISSTATAVLGVYYKLQSFVLMPVFGINNGLVPIIAFNYGAKNKERIIKAIKLSITYGVIIMILGLGIFQVFPRQLLSMFNASQDMLTIGVAALRIISISYIFAGFSIVAGSIYQAFGNGVFSLITAVSRQLVVLLPAAYFLSRLGNPSLIWWSFPIAEIASITLSTLFLKNIYKQKIQTIVV